MDERPRPISAGRLEARRRPLAVTCRRWLAWASWRHRYLLTFAVIGFLSIALEVGLVLAIAHLASGHSLAGSLAGFVGGMLFAFFGNYRYNFRVDPGRFWQTLGFFALISCLSYSLNMAAKDALHWISWESWAGTRFVTSGCLFLVAYTLHRQLTFRHSAKNLGLAVYVRAGTDIDDLYRRVGEHCDHIHFDLVDDTERTDAAPVDLEVIRRARRRWSWQPFHLHIMSRRPLAWVEACCQAVDAILVHPDGDDPLDEVLAACRLGGCGFGLVAHRRTPLARLFPWLIHCDFVLVLGVEQPGHSGQELLPEMIEWAHALAAQRERYGFRLIFDGGVRVSDVHHLPSDWVVSSSTVLRAENPVRAALALMTGVTHEQT